MIRLALAALLAAQEPAPAAQGCDPSITGASTGRLGYRNRGDRCEGRYAQPVSGSPLVPVSLTTTFRYDTTSTEPLVVSWSNPPEGDSVRVVARSTRQSVYYQMDATRPRADSSFEWRTDILSASRLRPDGIGIVGSTRTSIGRDSALVYLPLRVHHRGADTPCDTVRLGVWPGASADSVTVSVAPVSAAGTRGAMARSEAELGRGYYQSRRRIDVPLPDLATGLNWVRVVAWRNGNRNPLELYLYRAPPARCGS